MSASPTKVFIKFTPAQTSHRIGASPAVRARAEGLERLLMTGSWSWPPLLRTFRLSGFRLAHLPLCLWVFQNRLLCKPSFSSVCSSDEAYFNVCLFLWRRESLRRLLSVILRPSQAHLWSVFFSHAHAPAAMVQVLTQFWVQAQP